MNKKYNIGTVNLIMQPNGFAKGFILQRELTNREVMHILQNILGFANENYKDWFDREWERKDYRQQCKCALTEYLIGACDWSHLCNETDCYDDDETGFPMASAFPLACYLKQKGIIL